MVNIQHNFKVKAPVSKVYEAITQIDGLRNWWTTDVTGSPANNGELRFGFGEGMFNKMKVTLTELNKLVTWTCVDGPFEWIGTNLSFTLSEDNDKNTNVKFEQKNWKEATDFYGSCNFNWGLFMKSLKTLCETGTGMPHVVAQQM